MLAQFWQSGGKTRNSWVILIPKTIAVFFLEIIIPRDEYVYEEAWE